MKQRLYKGFTGAKWRYGYHSIKTTEFMTFDVIKTVEGVDHIVMPRTVAQNTGCRDNNGIDIYERDVVEWINAPGMEFDSGQVVWDDTRCAYYVQNDYVYEVLYNVIGFCYIIPTEV